MPLQTHGAWLLPQASVVLEIRGATRLLALKLLKSALADDPSAQEAWRSKAKVAAVLGSCPRSRASLKSGTVLAKWSVRAIVAHHPTLSVHRDWALDPIH